MVDLALKWPKKAPKSSYGLIWAEFLKLTCRPKKSKKAHLQAYKPDHPPAKPAQPTRPPEHFNGRLTDGLFVRLFSTDGQRICPKPEPPDPNPPLGISRLGYVLLHTKFT